MNTFYNLVVVVQVLSALIIIGLVLLQHGKGADMGAAFGSGASGSLFGASGSSNFMSKSTGVAAAIFFASTLALAYFSSDRDVAVSGGVMERAAPVTGPAAIPSTSTAPAAPVDPSLPTAPAATAPAAPAATPDAVPAAPAPAPAAPATEVPK
ncbi:preprotein translocase subunit SecG [Massilia sp. GCM10020059]|uniref:Protein-export membrane protein SecG n=1 Tax=Massilia agrisoli TaxID=2892444 RepID=A0ABS8ISX7_9BURK|nr:preprotein translocase subunit SecG [Massilia agrisoli]MCC6071752.1 preprotein translocase subunit SecG [Massilia agrisoli]